MSIDSNMTFKKLYKVCAGGQIRLDEKKNLTSKRNIWCSSNLTP